MIVHHLLLSATCERGVLDDLGLELTEGTAGALAQIRKASTDAPEDPNEAPAIGGSIFPREKDLSSLLRSSH